MDQRHPEPGDPPVIVVERKKKKKYSRGLRNLQQLERDTTQVSSRVIRALDKGMEAYREARNESSREQKDGALIELGPNIAEGVSTALKEMSNLPSDLTRGLRRKPIKRLIKGQVKLLARIGRLMGSR